MRHFHYENGEMYAENVSLRDIAGSVGTPVYVYSTATFERHYTVFAESFKEVESLVAYSVKANSNIAVLATLAQMGAGADVVSGGELARAILAGIPANKIVFSGVGKTRQEMQDALTAGIRVFNVESLPELEVLNDIAWSSAEAAYAHAATLPGIEIIGVDVHIGSQIDDLAPFKTAIEKVSGLITRLRKAGHKIKSFDIGGGLGIPYGDNSKTPPSPSEYGRMVKDLTVDMNVELIFEPGRMIAGNSGILLSEVLYVKKGEDRDFLIVNAAMNDLIRPALYEAYHEIEPVIAPGSGAEDATYDVVLVKGDKFEVIRERPSVAEILKSERLPDWLKEA